ncbi:MAG: hypothetical protein U5K27_05140 [Desulfotignum sp.]|nr:hypothetical protein [Desulfotignum sp.]
MENLALPLKLSGAKEAPKMKILLIYPEFPDTFWSFTHALHFIGKKAAFPPLGLITVAGRFLPVSLKRSKPWTTWCWMKQN